MSSTVSEARSTTGLPLRPVERVYAVVKERLLDGVYVADQRLVVDELTAELGVSRQPVFDVLRRLSAEGFVAITPQVGCRVIGFALAEIADFYELFASVEGAATRMAAIRRDDSDLKALRRIHEQISELVGLPSGDERAHGYRVHNRDFHSTIHRMCGTGIVETLGSSLYDRSDFMINGSAPVSPLADHVTERHADHALILAGLEAGDPATAGEAAENHIRGTVALIEQAVGRQARLSA
jgi:DNA-binding GntR family transcriptional regulator